MFDVWTDISQNKARSRQYCERFLRFLTMADLLNPLRANPTKWSNTVKQFVGNLRKNCLSVFHHFVKLALKGLKSVLFERNNSIKKKYALIYVTAQKMKFSIKDFFIFCIFSGLEIRKNIVSWKKIHSFEF